MWLGRGLLVATALAIAATLLVPANAPEARAALFIAAFVLFGALVVQECRMPTVSVHAVLLTSCAVSLVAVTRTPYGSHDLWSYAMYGRILVRFHRNPYTQLPAAFPGDPILRRVSPGWRHTSSVYGPGFTVLSAAIVSVTRSSAVATRLAFQSLSAGAFVFCSATVARAGAPRWAVAAVALNPLLLVTVVNGGHIDPLIAAFLLLAALAADRRRLFVAALALGAALSVKLVIVLPAGALIAWVARRYGVRTATMMAVVSLGPAMAGVLAFGGRGSLRPLVAGSHRFTRASIWSLLRHAPVLGHHFSTAALVLVGVVTVVLVVDGLDFLSPFDAVAAGALGYVLVAAYVVPWYLMWALPLAALGANPRALRMLLTYTAALAVAFGYRPSASPSAFEHVLHGAAAFTAIGLLVVTARVLCHGAMKLNAAPAALTP